MGRPKAGIILADGRAMIQHVHEALAAVCRQVVLVGDAAGVPPDLDDVPRVADRLPGLGPLGGLEALLGSELDTEYIIAPCDLPRVVPEVFLTLLEPGVTSPAVLAIEGDEHIQPLVARYGPSAHFLTQQMIREGRLAMRELARRSGAQVVPLPPGLASALQNANDPETLRDIVGSQAPQSPSV